MAIKAAQIRYQRRSGAFATTEPQPLRGFIKGHQINLGVAAVPPTLDAGGEREISQPQPAAFLVELPQQALQGAEVDGGRGYGQGVQPAAQEVVADRVMPLAGLGHGEHRQPLHHQHPFLRQGLQVPATWLPIPGFT